MQLPPLPILAPTLPSKEPSHGPGLCWRQHQSLGGGVPVLCSHVFQAGWSRRRGSAGLYSIFLVHVEEGATWRPKDFLQPISLSSPHETLLPFNREGTRWIKTEIGLSADHSATSDVSRCGNRHSLLPQSAMASCECYFISWLSPLWAHQPRKRSMSSVVCGPILGKAVVALCFGLLFLLMILHEFPRSDIRACPLRLQDIKHLGEK